MPRITFEYPSFLFLLCAIPVMAGVLWMYYAWRKRMRLRFSPQPTQKKGLLRSTWLSHALFLLAWGCMVVALANPRTIQQTRMSNTQKSSDVIVALDLSESMLADDVRPNRLVLARLFAQKLVTALEGNRIGLLFFAGNTYHAMPLSTDFNTAYTLLANADPYMITAQGTDLKQVIEAASTAFDAQIGTGRALVLITDGESHESGAEAAAASAFEDLGLLSIAVGVGTAEGGTIPTIQGKKLDKSGNVVTTKLEEKTLIGIASAGHGGSVLHIKQGDAAIQQIVQAISQLQKQEVVAFAPESKKSIFQWFLLPGLIFLFAGFVLKPSAL